MCEGRGYWGNLCTFSSILHKPKFALKNKACFCFFFLKDRGAFSLSRTLRLHLKIEATIDLSGPPSPSAASLLSVFPSPLLLCSPLAPSLWIPFICTDTWYLSFSFWLTSVCIEAPGSSTSLGLSQICSFSWLIFHCVHTPQLPYPFIHQVGGQFKREKTYLYLWLIHVIIWQNVNTTVEQLSSN